MNVLCQWSLTLVDLFVDLFLFFYYMQWKTKFVCMRGHRDIIKSMIYGLGELNPGVVEFSFSLSPSLSLPSFYI